MNRIQIEPRDRPGDGNILQYYPIEEAAWIWLPENDADAYLAEFSLEFELEKSEETVIHVSADQRYELYLDEERVGRGPDRSDLRHWSFASYPLKLSAGKHRLRALVSSLGEHAPAAQISYAPGFILSADGLGDQINTGSGAWMGRGIRGIQLKPGFTGVFHVIGPRFVIDGKAFFADARWGEVEQVRRIRTNMTGTVSPGPVLHPTRLPEQLSQYVTPEQVLAVQTGDKDLPWESKSKEEAVSWAGRLHEKELVIEPNTEVRCLIDMGDYYCGYMDLSVSGGKGSEIHAEWAESLFNDLDPLNQSKGNRDEWEGKYFHGFGDEFFPDGPERIFRSLWWRSGRYLQFYLKTGDEALHLNRIRIEETRYPSEFKDTFTCSDPSLDSIISIMRRGLECCAHEITVDCPYFEQLSYVGDTRIQALCWLALGDDDRLVKRELELYDWSRLKTGYVAERYPSHPFQLSVTFSMIWVLMLGDYHKWRDDPDFVRSLMPGMRSLLDKILALRNKEGLLERLPGWSFIDWVDGWEHGTLQAVRDGSCSILDLFFLMALKVARNLEDSFGEQEMASRWERIADEHATAIRDAYWDASNELYTNTPNGKRDFSLHAQCLAILAGLHSESDARTLLQRAMKVEGIDWPTPYFQFYLFETLAHVGMGGQILQEMDLWKRFETLGFKTPPEKEDPTRSDCHAWGSHPLFHLYSSVAGIRPVAAGMKRIQIAPSPGHLKSIVLEMPVMNQMLGMNLQFDGDAVSGTLAMPEGVEGEFVWRGKTSKLDSGQLNQIEL